MGKKQREKNATTTVKGVLYFKDPRWWWQKHSINSNELFNYFTIQIVENARTYGMH